MPLTVIEERTNDLTISDDGLGNPSQPGQIRHVSGDLVAFVGGSVKSLTTGTGLNPTTHRDLDQLVHLIAETSFLEVTRSGGQVSSVIVWTSSAKTQKVRETLLTRTSGQVSQVEIKQYDGAGTLAETLTGTVARTGGRLDSIDWVLV